MIGKLATAYFMPRISEMYMGSPIWRLQRLVLPRIILEILDLSLERKDFRKWLLEYANRGGYRKHRVLYRLSCLRVGFVVSSVLFYGSHAKPRGESFNMQCVPGHSVPISSFHSAFLLSRIHCSRC